MESSFWRNTQSLGDSTAQLVELKAQIRALQNMDCEFPTLIVCDLFYCVQSYNEYLHYGARMSRDSSVHSEAQAALGTIGKAERKPATGACYSCIESSTCWRSRCREFNGGWGHQGNSTHCCNYSSTIADGATMIAANGTCNSSALPLKYSYKLDAQNILYAQIPGVGDRVIPNTDHRLGWILAAHKGLGSAHGISATVSLLKQRYWWPGLTKQTKDFT